MAQLIVRNLESDVKDRLAKRARRHGRSMEEEVRDILRNAVRQEVKPAPDIGFGDRLANYFAEHGLDFEVPEIKGEKARPASFD